MNSAAFAVLTAAGSGTRLGCDGPKALVPIAGVPMVVRAARGLATAGIRVIVVTAPAEYLEEFSALFGEGVVAGAAVRVVAGSPASRQASVALGMAALADVAASVGESLEASSPVLVHDAARCLTPPEAIARVVDAVRVGAPAVIPVLPVADTLKEVETPLQAGAGADVPATIAPAVVATPDRSHMVAVQTPQGFTWNMLERAHAAAAARAASEATAATDDAGLVEALGERVVVVAGDALALKVTTAFDLDFANFLTR